MPAYSMVEDLPGGVGEAHDVAHGVERALDLRAIEAPHRDRPAEAIVADLHGPPERIGAGDRAPQLVVAVGAARAAAVDLGDDVVRAVVLERRGAVPPAT